MKKLEYDQVAFVWMMIVIMLSMLLFIVIIPGGLYILAGVIGIIVFALGIPATFTWFWNRFIVKDD